MLTLVYINGDYPVEVGDTVRVRHGEKAQVVSIIESKNTKFGIDVAVRLCLTGQRRIYPPNIIGARVDDGNIL